MRDDQAGDRRDSEPAHDTAAEWRANAIATAEEVDRLLRSSVEARPIETLGVAVGVGFLLGLGLPKGTLTMLLGVGVRFAGSWLRQEIAQGLQEALRPEAQRTKRAA